MPNNTLAAWVIARLLRGEVVDGNIIVQIAEPYRAIAQTLADRNERAALEVFDAELAKLAPEVGHEVRAAVLSADPQSATPPTTEPKEEIVLLDSTPLAIRRPLCLINGHVYAATWVSVRHIVHSEKSKDGKLIEHKTPIVTESRELCIVRDDGVIFSKVDLSSFGNWQPRENLGLVVHLPTEGDPAKVWSGAGVKRYLTGERPDPLDVFKRVVAVVHRFLDFDLSLASQTTMAEMIACYVLASYLLDAFNVVGYLWPTGLGGSGKTTLIHLVAELGYLGLLILFGVSYAFLRDLSDYGAVLCFDDAENLAGGKKNQDKLDPDKRALLLAGNRRGSTVPLKEFTPPKTWIMRYVSTFCPKTFSAIQLPDPVLASRTIVVPLIRTIDNDRANNNPADYIKWPHDRNRLIDDLWALGLAYLRELPQHAQAAKEAARLSGRALEPWHAILGVAHWLTERGEQGLFQRMEELSVAYQRERADLETFNPGLFVLRALVELGSQTNADPLIVTTSQIKNMVKQMTSEGDADETEDDGVALSPHRIGSLLRQWRIEKRARPGGKGPRQWSVARATLDRLAKSYGVVPSTAQTDSSANNPSMTECATVPDVPLALPEVKGD